MELMINKIKKCINNVRIKIPPYDYNFKPIESNFDSYYAYPNQLISLEDMCLTLKNDCAEILSKAIRAEKITLFYHHKTIEENGQKKMVIYTMTNDLFINGEVRRCIHRLYFDKYDIVMFLKSLPFTKEYINIFEVPPERVATKDNVHKIMKKVIRKTNCSRERPIITFRIHDFVITAGLVVIIPFLLFKKIYAFIKTYNQALSLFTN